MANDCLVTKLKGIVNNPTLKKLGCVQVKVKFVETPDSNTNHFTFGLSSSATVRVISGNIKLSNTAFADYNNPTGGLTEITISGWADIFVSNSANGGVIEIDHKYDFYGIHASNASAFVFNLEDFDYSPIRILRTYVANFEGNPSSIKNWASLLSEFTLWNYVSNGELTGNLAGKDFNSLSIRYVTNEIIDLAQLLSGATAANFNGALGLVGNAIDGSLDYFLVNNNLRFPSLLDMDMRDNSGLEAKPETIARLRELGVSLNI